MFEQLLARLNVDGTIKKASSPETAGANKVVLTGYDGLIDPSLVPLGSPTLGSITASKITYDHTYLPETNNLQELLETFNGITTGGLTADYFLKVEQALAEFDDTQQIMAFENIKQVGTSVTSGVIFPAAYNQTLNVTAEDPHTPYAVGPKTANYRYLIKNNGNPDTPTTVAVDPQTMQGLVAYTPTLSTGLLNPATAITTLVSKEYVDSAVSTTLNVRTQPIFWVSPVGSDTGGASQYYSLTYPYASIQKALSDATNWRQVTGIGTTSPLTVVVMPGAYEVSTLAGTALAASYVNLHFMPGAKLTYSGEAGAPLFNFNSGNPGFSVTGYGEFYLTNTHNGSSLVSCPNNPATANTTINFECQSITATSGKAIVLDYDSSDTHYLTANISIKGDILNSSSNAAIYLDRNNLLQLQINGNLTSLNGVGIYVGATNISGCAKSVQNIVLKDMTCAHECFFITKCGDLTITANKLITTGGYATVHAASNTGEIMLQANKIIQSPINPEGGSHCVYFSDGYLQIKDAQLKTLVNTQPVIGVYSTTGRLTLKNLDLTAAANGATIARIGAGASASVYLIGYIRTNSSTHTYINFQGGVFDYIA